MTILVCACAEEESVCLCVLFSRAELYLSKTCLCMSVCLPIMYCPLCIGVCGWQSWLREVVGGGTHHCLNSIVDNRHKL